MAIGRTLDWRGETRTYYKGHWEGDRLVIDREVFVDSLPHPYTDPHPGSHLPARPGSTHIAATTIAAHARYMQRVM